METVSSAESKLKNEIETKVKEEPFEVFEACEQTGIDLITKDDFNQ